MKNWILIISIAFVQQIFARQVVLQPWTEVYGTVQGQGLGNCVLGITPSANLPYRAAITHGGYTSFYRLQTPTDTAAMFTIYGVNPHIGDLNGDGWKDLVLSVPDTNFSSGNVVDTVYIYWGTPTGLDTSHPTKLLGSNDYSIGVSPGFGTHMCIGNLIDDSIADLVVCEPLYGNAQGRVYIYEGGSNFSSVPSLVLTGDSADYSLGWDCAIGDINNDGHNDLMVGGVFEYGVFSTRFNYVDVWLGGTTFDTNRYLRTRGISSIWMALACFDVNGDGIPDLLWTTTDSYGAQPIVRVHYGGGSFGVTANLELNNPGMANFGNPIVNAGDMNGDGYNDIALGAPSADESGDGFVVVFCGGPKIDGNYDAAVGKSFDGGFGYSISSVGDINGDGLADIIVGAPGYFFGNNKGYWGIFKGDSTIQVTAVKDKENLPNIFKLYQSYPNPFNPRTTIHYDLQQEAQIKLMVVNEAGQLIATLVDKRQPPGSYDAIFDGSQIASSVYFYTLSVTLSRGIIYKDTKKLILAK